MNNNVNQKKLILEFLNINGMIEIETNDFTITSYEKKFEIYANKQLPKVMYNKKSVRLFPNDLWTDNE